MDQFAKRVMAGELDPYAAADALIAGLTEAENENQNEN